MKYLKSHYPQSLRDRVDSTIDATVASLAISLASILDRQTVRYLRIGCKRREMNNGGGQAGYVPSPYVLNIIGLQNVQTSAAGLSATANLSNAVCNLQQMVDFDTKTIFTNNLNNYNATPLQILTDLNLSNTNLYQNSNLIVLSTSNTTTGNSGYTSTLTTGGAVTAFVNGSGFFVTGSGDFTGSVTAANFVTASDQRLKMKIETIANSERALGDLRGVRFQWRDTGVHDVGVIAQEVAEVIPEAVMSTSKGELYVAYDKMIPFLVESVKALLERVNRLEQIVGWEKIKE
jgi:hypothetical protein